MKIGWLLLCLLACFFTKAQQLYSFEEVDSLQKTAPRPVVVFIHTNWCKYCLMMEETTFKNEELQKELTQHFYFVSFDAESKQTIHFNGTSFKNTTGKEHELALALAKNERGINYPSVVFLTAQNEIMHQQNGFTDALTFLQLVDLVLNRD